MVVLVPHLIDLVIVPGLAFDTTGNRLGRGGGFYDRFLRRLRRSATTVGLAFDAQVVDTVLQALRKLNNSSFDTLATGGDKQGARILAPYFNRRYAKFRPPDGRPALSWSRAVHR